MTTETKRRVSYTVVCPGYRTGDYGTREAAERAAREINERGSCVHDHHVEEQDYDPSKIVPTIREAGCRWCDIYGRACGRHERS